jgi:hypothetical protein
MLLFGHVSSEIINIAVADASGVLILFVKVDLYIVITQRHSIGRLPDVEGDRLAKTKFKTPQTRSSKCRD